MEARRFLGRVLVAAMALGTAVFGGSAAMADEPVHRVYVTLENAKEHPDYERRHVQPPNWDTFGGRVHFTALRGFGMKDDNAIGYAEELTKYVDTYGLGDVVWPSYDLIFAKNIGDVADEFKKRNLFLFDIWGYVPGSGPGGYWQQFKPPAGVFDVLESKLGDHWLGMDIGEQDGRYIGGYASQMYPISDDRFEQYLNFQRHFERMTDELGNKNSTLVSLNYGHYFLKEGVYTLIGAETAQGLPNGQVYYSFIRGAGKQYGVPWFGNASVWNRWGYKSYGGEGDDHGPTKGTSLSLLKRLMYTHVLYNCVLVGFEAGWIEKDALTPIGTIQASAAKWVAEHGQPGTMVTPIALMTDFSAGWTFPRHLYAQEAYRVWGSIPYEAGDYLTDGVLDMLYPGYQDSSFFHNESGFATPTPYGDAADCLLSDAPAWLLDRYPLLVIAGALQGGQEIRDKLEAYAEKGGVLVITAGNVARMPEGVGGIRVAGTPSRVEAGNEGGAFELYPLSVPESAVVSKRVGDKPAVVEVACGKGRVVVLASPYGVTADAVVNGRIRPEIDKPLPRPRPLVKHVRDVLDGVLRSQVLFDAGEGLSVVVCRKAPGEYTLGVANNGLEPRPFKIVSHVGVLEEVRELVLDQSEKAAVGYLPTGSEGANVGVSDAATISGGDVRLFAARVKEQGVQEIPHVAPASGPKGRILPLREGRSIKESILARPTFFEHYDGVTVDWRYLRDRDAEAIAREKGWLERQGVRIYVDFTSGINLYPDLRLTNNDEPEYQASMKAVDAVMAKMGVLGAKDLILSIHRDPENNFTREQTQSGFETTLKDLCARAAERGITVFLRTSPKAGNQDLIVRLMDRVAAPNLRLAASTAMLMQSKANPADLGGAFKGKLGLWLASAPGDDIGEFLWTANQPIATPGATETIRALLATAPGVPVAFDAVYKTHDDEYRDAKALTQTR